MWKRLTALFFILILGGQVWAGVCGCFNDGQTSRMKCCLKKSKEKRDSVSRTKCCDGPCGLPSSDRTPRNSSDTGIKLPVLAEIPEVRFEFVPPTRTQSRPLLAFSAVWDPSQLSRPPNLYLRHHSFLI